MSKSGWEEAKLGDIAQLVTAKSKPDAESRYIALEHINGEGSNSINGWASGSDYKSASVKFENGDILFSKLRPYLNKVWQAEFDGFATGEALVYRAFPEKVTQDFLYLILRSHDAVKYADDRSIGTRMPRIAPKIMAEFTVNVPPLDVQPEIVDFMQALDHMIQAGDREISSAEQMREDVLRTLLTDENDKWAEKPLMDVVNLQNGYAFKPKDLGTTGKPVVRIKQLFDPTATVDHSDIDIPEKFWITTGDIIFTWSARIDVAIWDRGDAYLNQHLFKVTTKDESVLSQDFTYMVIAEMIPHLTSHGTTMKHVTKTELNRQLVYIPPVEEQEKIVEKMQTLDTYIDSAKRSQEALKQVRQDALHALLSGDKDVRELAEMFATEEDVA